ncbi:antitoxin MazE-like protein [Bosea sp. (in: a-proteobacteria)]|uniref:antitoxin MazE-like protein n=1 Tax=Bosea sp. (in: a-proteobacteria) TaxID=1871050 RepID=UPI003568780E
MPPPVNQRVQKRRNRLRASGLRPLQIWVPRHAPGRFPRRVSPSVARRGRC